MLSSHRVIFVVDDEHVIAQTLAIILNQAGFEAHAFVEPQKAIAALEEMIPDLLLADVVMPEMTGIELAIYFRKALPQCEVLLFSGVAGVWDMLASPRAEGYDFELLTKPVHPADFLAKLHGAPVTGFRPAVLI